MACFRVSLIFLVVATGQALQFPSGFADLAGQPKDEVVGESGQEEPDTFTGLHPIRETADSFHEVKTGISELEQYIEEQEQTTFDDINAQKAVYQEELLHQRQNNSALLTTIRHVEKELNNVEATNVKLRREAEHLRKQNAQLSTDLEGIERDLGLAQELVNLALNFSSQQLFGADELKVLSELTEEDNKANHQAELSKFSGQPLSLLSVARKNQNLAFQSPDQKIEQLGASLSKAAAKRTADLLNMKESFERLHAEGEKKNEELVKRLEELNATVEEATQTHEQLLKAVLHLNQTREALTQRVLVLRTFGDKVLGGNVDSVDDAPQQVSALAAAVKLLNGKAKEVTQRALQIFGGRRFAIEKQSLLQVVDPEPPLKDLKLPGTQAVYDHVKRHAVELQNAIEVQENRSLDEMHSRRAMYAQSLAAQQRDIDADELINHASQDTLGSLRQEVTDLRRQANELMTENVALTGQLEMMQKNITTAFEFVNASVYYAFNRTRADPNLEVLDELRRQDAVHTHSQELKAFAGFSSLSMLTTGNVTKSVAKTPEAFVSILRTNLAEAVAESNASLAKLDKTFTKLLSQGEKKHASVLRMQAELNRSIADSNVTKQRLEQAVNHLRQSQEILSDKIEALRVFGRERLGHEAQPATPAKQPASKQLQKLDMLSEEHETPDHAVDNATGDAVQMLLSDLSDNEPQNVTADAPKPGLYPEKPELTTGSQFVADSEPVEFSA